MEIDKTILDDIKNRSRLGKDLFDKLLSVDKSKYILYTSEDTAMITLRDYDACSRMRQLVSDLGIDENKYYIEYREDRIVIKPYRDPYYINFDKIYGPTTWKNATIFKLYKDNFRSSNDDAIMISFYRNHKNEKISYQLASSPSRIFGKQIYLYEDCNGLAFSFQSKCDYEYNALCLQDDFVEISNWLNDSLYDEFGTTLKHNMFNYKLLTNSENVLIKGLCNSVLKKDEFGEAPKFTDQNYLNEHIWIVLPLAILLSILINKYGAKIFIENQDIRFIYTFYNKLCPNFFLGFGGIFNQ